MMRVLFQNTVVTAISVAVTSVLGLVAVRIIVGTWGLSEFGLIVLARAFLPVGFLAAVDLGVSEIATQVVARARVNSDWRVASQRLTIVVVLSTFVGILVAAAMILLAPALVLLFRVPDDHA